MNTNVYSINISGHLIELSRPLIMGIVNATPDSFYAESRHQGQSAADAVAAMLEHGADIIDLGGCSTRPGSREISSQEESDRLDFALEAIRKRFPDVIISIDTWRADVARRCVQQWNANIINDIGGGTLDPQMWSTVAELKVPYILMHLRGTPQSMDAFSDYDNLCADILRDLAFKVDRLRELGVCDIIVDPGFGFAKSIEGNYELLANLDLFHELGTPVLAGLSRKRMIWQSLDISAEEALPGTIAANTVALLNGADIIRVHDVEAARQTRGVVEAVTGNYHPNPNSINRIFK